MPEITIAEKKPRAPFFDSLRGCAMILMATYHFCFDLNYFGVIHQYMNYNDGWLAFRALIMTLFTGLVGVGLYLSNANFKSIGFWKRQLRVGSCALFITAYSYVMFPETWVYFGILHFIFAASFLGPGLVRNPRISLVVGVIFILLPMFYRDSDFAYGVLGLIGLANEKPMTEDFAPIFPWLGTLLVGVFIGYAYRRWAQALGRFELRALTRLGEHSLVFYMVHQAVLFPMAWLIKKLTV